MAPGAVRVAVADFAATARVLQHVQKADCPHVSYALLRILCCLAIHYVWYAADCLCMCVLLFLVVLFLPQAARPAFVTLVLCSSCMRAVICSRGIPQQLASFFCLCLSCAAQVGPSLLASAHTCELSPPLVLQLATSSSSVC